MVVWGVKPKIMKKYYILFLTSILIYSAQAQVNISGVAIPDKLKVQNEELTLNGAGIRIKYFMDLYVGSLFLVQKGSDAKAIIKGEEPMAVRLNIISGMITSDRMEESVNDGFEKATNGDLSKIQVQVDRMLDVFSEEIEIGDEFQFNAYKNTVDIYKNGDKLTTIKGKEFKEALFAIWLGDKPADKALRRKMLNIK